MADSSLAEGAKTGRIVFAIRPVILYDTTVKDSLFAYDAWFYFDAFALVFSMNHSASMMKRSCLPSPTSPLSS